MIALLLSEDWQWRMLSPVSVTVRNTIMDFAIFISSLLSNGQDQKQHADLLVFGNNLGSGHFIGFQRGKRRLRWGSESEHSGHLYSYPYKIFCLGKVVSFNAMSQSLDPSRHHDVTEIALDPLACTLGNAIGSGTLSYIAWCQIQAPYNWYQPYEAPNKLYFAAII